MMKVCCLIVIILCTIYVTNGGILTRQCLASNGTCGTKGQTCEQKFGQGWINKGRCCNKNPCCGEDESKVKPEIKYSCGFETPDQCFLKQSTYDDFDWTRTNESTPTSGTGPTSAAQGRYYMFIEATGKHTGLKAALKTEGTNLQADSWCLSFQYHMRGPDIGSLKVYAGNSTNLSIKWSKSGQQSDPLSWKTATIDITEKYSNLRIFIGATTDEDDQGDMAIDDIILKSGTCTNP